MAASPPSGPGEPAPPPPPLQYSLLLQHLVGDKRQPRVWDPATLGGIPCPPKSDEQKMVERVMESCPFKAALACVGGAAAGRTGQAALGSFGGPCGFGTGVDGEEAAAHVFDFPPNLLQCLSDVPGRDLCLPCRGKVLMAFPQPSTGRHECPQYREIPFPVTVQHSHSAEPLHCLQGMCCSNPAQFIPFCLSFYLLQDLFWEVRLVSSQLALTPTWGLIPRIPIAHPLPKRCSRTWGSEASPTPRISPSWVPCSPARNAW